jgi:flagellar hook-basal body complex protein FliE
MDIDSYATAIGSVKPGTFVPDLTPKAPASSPLSTDEAAGTTAATSFKDTVKSLLEDVNDKMVNANQTATDLATGKSNDLEGGVKAMEQASLAFQMTMGIRNKLMEAYQELQQMQF